MDPGYFLGELQSKWRFRKSPVINLQVMVLVGEVAHYDLYRSIAIVQWNELFQRGFVTDGVKCLGIVQEYLYCSLIQIQGFSNNISEFK